MISDNEKNGENSFFDIGACYEHGTVTVEYDCCDGTHEHGKECIHFTPEKAVFLAYALLEKVLNLHWAKKEEKPKSF